MSIEQYRARVQRLVSRRFGRKEASAGELLRFWEGRRVWPCGGLAGSYDFSTESPEPQISKRKQFKQVGGERCAYKGDSPARCLLWAFPFPLPRSFVFRVPGRKSRLEIKLSSYCQARGSSKTWSIDAAVCVCVLSARPAVMPVPWWWWLTPHHVLGPLCMHSSSWRPQSANPLFDGPDSDWSQVDAALGRAGHGHGEEESRAESKNAALSKVCMCGVCSCMTPSHRSRQLADLGKHASMSG